MDHSTRGIEAPQDNDDKEDKGDSDEGKIFENQRVPPRGPLEALHIYSVP